VPEHLLQAVEEMMPGGFVDCHLSSTSTRHGSTRSESTHEPGIHSEAIPIRFAQDVTTVPARETTANDMDVGRAPPPPTCRPGVPAPPRRDRVARCERARCRARRSGL
jgi:hypothetical protein